MQSRSFDASVKLGRLMVDAGAGYVIACVAAPAVMRFWEPSAAVAGLRIVPPATGAPAASTFHMPATRYAVPLALPFDLTATVKAHGPEGKLKPAAASTVHPLQVAGIDGVGELDGGTLPAVAAGATPGVKSTYVFPASAASRFSAFPSTAVPAGGSGFVSTQGVTAVDESMSA